MAVKISDLIEATEFIITDIFHLRTAGGIDKRITGANLRSDLGMIAPFASKVNAGWLWCDGATIDKTANPEYEPLVDYLKAEAGADAAHPYYAVAANEAVLPDLRGAGVRGVDAAANRDQDGVRKSGGYQADDNKTHLHTINHQHAASGGAGAHTHTISGEQAVNAPGTTLGDLQQHTTGGYSVTGALSNPGDHTHTNTNYNGNSGSTGAVEATMKNVAAYYLIRY